MIERVEVVRGGGSALFGSNAIAGTINIITREPTSNSMILSNTSSLIYGKASDFNTSLNGSIVSENNKTGIMIFGSTRQRSALDYDGDDFTEIGEIDVKNIGFRGSYKPTIYSRLTLEYHNLGEFRRGGNNLDLPPHESDITEQTEHNINTGGIKYDWFSKNMKHRFNTFASAQKIARKSYYGAQKDPNAYGTTFDKTGVVGFQYTCSFDTLLFMPSALTLGSEYSENQMTDKMLGYHRAIDQSVNTSSVFFQNEWKNKKLSILIGGRLDKHNLIKNPILSPRLNLRYSPSDRISFRASYSTGFRAPQAFDEDLHITAVGGQVTLIRLNPDLKAEKSQSVSGSVDYYHAFGHTLFNLLIEGFHTRLNHVFVLEEVGTDYQGNILLERRNRAGAVVQGINFEGKVVPNDNLQLQFGITFQTSRYNEPEIWSDNTALSPQKIMFRSPDQYGYITANYVVRKKLTVSLSGIYTGSMRVQHFAGYVAADTEKISPSFYDVNMKIAYDFRLNASAKLQVSTGMQNIFNSYQNDFDKGEFRDAGYMYGPALPRTFTFGVKLVI